MPTSVRGVGIRVKGKGTCCAGAVDDDGDIVLRFLVGLGVGVGLSSGAEKLCDRGHLMEGSIRTEGLDFRHAALLFGGVEEGVAVGGVEDVLVGVVGKTSRGEEGLSY